LLALLGAGCELPDEKTSADGATLFARHCASCHGANGDGSGPLAAELHKPPANLRTLAQRNGGKYDEGAVMASIDGRRAVASHGPRDMPVWGAVFESELEERGERAPHYTTLLRARLLADYVRTLQD
jgi:mono/diheme cytochrome c family protein